MRYRVIGPTPNGYAWWNIIDTQSSKYWGEDNFSVVTVSIRVKNAEIWIKALCDAMNAENK
jgi:hypothetical protein